MVEDRVNGVVSIENIFLAHRAPTTFWRRLRETLRIAYYYWRMPSPPNYEYSYPELGRTFRVVIKEPEKPVAELQEPVVPETKGWLN